MKSPLRSPSLLSWPLARYLKSRFKKEKLMQKKRKLRETAKNMLGFYKSPDLMQKPR
jgi:hypothetical protein